RQVDPLAHRLARARVIGAEVLDDDALGGELTVVDVERDRFVVAAVAAIQLGPPLAGEVVDEAEPRRPVVVDANLGLAGHVLDLLSLPAQSQVEDEPRQEYEVP